MDILERDIHQNDLLLDLVQRFPVLMTRHIDRQLRSLCGGIPLAIIPRGVPNLVEMFPIEDPNEETLQEMYPQYQGNRLTVFRQHIRWMALLLVAHYKCEYFRTHLNNLDLLRLTHSFLVERGEELRNNYNHLIQTTGGGSYKYKGRTYVIRRGARCGKYILVKGKKVYLSQI